MNVAPYFIFYVLYHFDRFTTEGSLKKHAMLQAETGRDLPQHP